MLIGLAGYALSGKTSIAQAVARVNKYPIHSFAAALKARIDPLFPAKTPKSIMRDTYVAYGRAMRYIQADYWIKELSLKFVLSEPSALVDDVRYPNEVDWITSRGGIVFLIQRKGIGPANDEERESFAQMPEIPIIENNGTIEGAAKRVLEGIQHKG
jgi:hypothetical protein